MQKFFRLILSCAASLLIAFVATTMTSCFGFESPEEELENTEPEIPREPLTSGPATVAITGATATTAIFDGSIINEEIDLDFLQVTIRYAELDVFSAMNEELPKVVITRPDIKDNKFSFTIKDLKYNTPYKFCAIVQYQSDVFYSKVEEFKTANIANTLAVKSETITENSAEIAGRFYGFSDVDCESLEMGLFYSHDKSLVEKGEGTKVVFEEMGADGSVSVVLTDLYFDGPTYHFCTYVKQGEESKLGKVITFELINEPVRLVKKITRHEDVMGDRMTWTYEFEYENNKLVGSKWTEEEEEYVDGYRFTYDYSTKGKVVVGMYYFDESGEKLEQTYEIAIDAKGNALNYKYTWDDDWGDHIEYYHYDVNFTYTPEGYLAGWSETDGEDRFGMTYSYVDGRLNRIDVDYGDDDEDVPEEDKHLMVPGFSGNVDMKNTSYDLNKVLFPYFIESEIGSVSAVKTGTIGKYYLDRMMVESIYSYGPDDLYRGTTTDPKYSEVVTYSTYEFEKDEIDTFPITSVTYDKDGYPTEFVADVRARRTDITVTFGAGDVEWVDDWDGTTYYRIVEVDRKTTSSPTEVVGKASAVVEYCD